MLGVTIGQCAGESELRKSQQVDQKRSPGDETFKNLGSTEKQYEKAKERLIEQRTKKKKTL